MDTLKIGQEITITEDFEIEGGISGNKLTVKKGDKGIVDSHGFIHYLSGNARGKIQKIKDANMKGYDTENLATHLFKRLNAMYNLGEFLEGYDIEKEEFISEIQDVLSDIL